MSASGHSRRGDRFGWVILVASLGGISALTAVLKGLPSDFAVPVVVAQHRRPTPHTGDVLVEIFNRRTGLPVRMAEPGEPASQPGVTVVPAGTIATLDADGAWSLTTQPSNSNVGNAILASAAAQAPTIAVILTGLLSDGAEGCRAVKRHGGRVLVQDPSTAEAASMPAHAIATGCVDFVLPLERLAATVLALTAAPGGADLLSLSTPPWAHLDFGA
ncbi:chemotaxis protein CheB [Mycobacterium simiae]|uniref:chemotaxis protein CheB n=1 Tax=Mycobacterium simiae TaxID=1784 RepID=UPI00262F7FE2|nr:chemotaxis protein CheB [Mycobacterium simiae]